MNRKGKEGAFQRFPEYPGKLVEKIHFAPDPGSQQFNNTVFLQVIEVELAYPSVA